MSRRGTTQPSLAETPVIGTEFAARLAGAPATAPYQMAVGHEVNIQTKDLKKHSGMVVETTNELVTIASKAWLGAGVNREVIQRRDVVNAVKTS